MALLTRQSQHGFLQYLRLKITASLLRAFVSITSSRGRKRDRSLVRDDVRRETISIPSRDPNRSIAASIPFPPGYSASSPAPVLVNWHGSGFVLPLLGSDVVFCSRVAQAGIVVVDADYRKGPEHPFPTALNDIEDTLRWVAAQEGLDPRRAAVSGFSAGACLALVAASTLRAAQSRLDIRAVVSIFPITDLSMAPEHKKVPHPIKPHPVWALHLFNDCYTPDRESRKSPAISPSFAEVADFPPTTAIITCGRDPLRPEATQLAERIRQDKNSSQDVVLHELEGVCHGFDKGAQEGTLEWTRREEAYELALKLLKQALDD